ncbi:MAG TPA: site-2 protease family protein [Terriglobales bacterium]|nr:site-2 protease family protein [Terriglobales bacterium]
MSIEHVGFVFQIIVFLFAISFHESAHAFTAWKCGDPTAYMLGRVTLNPLKHIDPVGTVILPGIALLTGLPVIGWAKPTPVDPRNFKNEVRDDILTSVAGPASNILVAAGAVGVMAGIASISGDGRALVRGLAGNFPIPVAQTSLWVPVVVLLYQAMLINLLLAVFNLIPIPPLDGSHVLRHLLPESIRQVYDMVGWMGLVLLFLVGGRVVFTLLQPVLRFFDALLLLLA